MRAWHSASRHPTSTGTPPRRRRAMPLPGDPGVLVEAADDDPAETRGEHRLGAGPRAAGVAAGLERHIQGGARGPTGRQLRGPRSPRGVRPPGGGSRSPTTRPPRTRTAPTIGIRAGGAPPALGQPEGQPHEPPVLFRKTRVAHHGGAPLERQHPLDFAHQLARVAGRTGRRRRSAGRPRRRDACRACQRGVAQGRGGHLLFTQLDQGAFNAIHFCRQPSIGTGRFSQAFFSPASSLLRSNGSRRPSFLTTRGSISSTRS